MSTWVTLNSLSRMAEIGSQKKDNNGRMSLMDAFRCWNFELSSWLALTILVATPIVKYMYFVVLIFYWWLFSPLSSAISSPVLNFFLLFPQCSYFFAFVSSHYAALLGLIPRWCDLWMFTGYVYGHRKWGQGEYESRSEHTAYHKTYYSQWVSEYLRSLLFLY